MIFLRKLIYLFLLSTLAMNSACSSSGGGNSAGDQKVHTAADPDGDFPPPDPAVQVPTYSQSDLVADMQALTKAQNDLLQIGRDSVLEADGTYGWDADTFNNFRANNPSFTNQQEIPTLQAYADLASDFLNKYGNYIKIKSEDGTVQQIHLTHKVLNAVTGKLALANATIADDSVSDQPAN